MVHLRLPRVIGERRTRDAILFNTRPPAGSDELRPPGGRRCLHRRNSRVAAEPLDVFRRYMANYAREQSLSLYSDALISNLERNWDAHRR